MKKIYFLLPLLVILSVSFTSCKKGTLYKTLIITDQNDPNGKENSAAIKQILDETGLFSSAILSIPGKGEDMTKFNRDFPKYKLIVLDNCGDSFAEKTDTALVDYISNGGGVVVCNSKNEPGSAIASVDSVIVSKRHNFMIRTFIADHPITKGLPINWMQAGDQIVHVLSINKKNMLMLATAFSDSAYGGSGMNEPVLIARSFGKGRVFHTLLGSPDENGSNAVHSSGFIVTLQRGAEWAASGTVTQEVPSDFPTNADVVIRPDFKEITLEEAFNKIGAYDIPKSTRYYTFIQSRIRKASGNEKTLLMLEKKMVNVLRDANASTESKKLMLRELSWMGTEYCIPAIKELISVPELKNEADFTLTRLK